MAPMCSEISCNARCHQAFNRLTTKQICDAKSCGNTITWKCCQHSTSIVEIIIPPPPVFELPRHPSAAGKLCAICNNPIPSCYANLAYLCEDLSCANVCHLSAICSGFVNPSGTARTCELSTRIWRSHLHSSAKASGHSSTQHYTSPPRPTPPSLNSLVSQGMSLADAKSSKETCAKCSAALRSSTVPVRCNACNKGFHQKCSTGPKALTRDDQWKCDKCTKLQQNRLVASNTCQISGSTDSTPSQT